MGVPAFFRWLQKKYPSIVVHCIEEKPKHVDDVKVPVDSSQPNPNDYEFDNLYLDMNGIIHPCSHPENKAAPKNEAEMMVNIFEYIDRIFSICRPRRLLYMAIDGVAPRAKMNQQRSRRFRAAKESRESREVISKIKEELRSKGCKLPPEEEKKEHFDSNCITPGTEFMDRLSFALRYYISDRLTNDPGWKDIKVILSDANTPGEGEHKIMDYIRKQRAQPDHDPNTKHCLNGADADLIMLGLATHEAHFTIIREEFKPNEPKPCAICGQGGHEKEDCQGLPQTEGQEDDDNPAPFVGNDVEFIFIRLHVLREYLERDLKMEGIPFGYDFERALDDWVFMCFFVGNDFLPHLPSLEIREGGIDKLVGIYKHCLPRMGGYLAENGICDLKRVQLILQELGKLEDEIFRKRQEFELRMKKRRQDQNERNKRQKMEGRDSSSWTPRSFSSPVNQSPTPGQTPRNYQNNRNNANLLTPTPDGNPNTPGTPNDRKRSASQAFDTTEKKEPDEPEDNIRLWEEGWRDRYYLHKFGISHEKDPAYFLDFRSQVANEYVLGLAWVLLYYYQGCPSWKWFYPFHYAPFASDFLAIEKVDTSFEKGTQPFQPLQQLMSVFPAASGKFLPPTWREKMSAPDSEIIDFYPVDFKIDLNGKKWAWQGVALLPFVDEQRLFRTLKPLYGDLTVEEKTRSRRDQPVLFVGNANKMYSYLMGLHENKLLSEEEKQDIVTDFSIGMRGLVYEDKLSVPPGSVYPSPVPGTSDLPTTACVSVRYLDPVYDENFIYPSKPLENATPPDRVLKPGDFPKDRNYRPSLGMSGKSYSPYTPSPGAHRMIRHEMGSNSPNNRGYNNSYQGNQNRSFNRSHNSSYGSPHGGSYGGSQGGSPHNLMNTPTRFTPPYGGGRQSSPYNDSFNRSQGSYGSNHSGSFNNSQSYRGGGNNFSPGTPRGNSNRSYGDNRNNNDDRRRSNQGSQQQYNYNQRR